MSNVGVMLLSNNENSSELYDWISQRESVVAWSDAIRMEDILRFKPQLVISYNYVHIVPADIIEMLGRRMINMHISFLPYNRGCSPNLWSFIDDTPKGVTIHQMSEKLDRGGVYSYKKNCILMKQKKLSELHMKNCKRKSSSFVKIIGKNCTTEKFAQESRLAQGAIIRRRICRSFAIWSASLGMIILLK